MFTRRMGDAQSESAVASGLDQATWIGHATYLLQMGGVNILVDPNWALWHSIFKRVRRPGLAIEDLPRIDLILITHAHYDHLHLKSLERIADGQPILVPKGVASLMQRFHLKPVEMSWWDEYPFRQLRLIFTPARHWGARFLHDVHRGFGGYVIEGRDHTVFHAGDSAAFEGFAEVGARFDIDLALLPIGGYEAPSGREVHMNPEEALDAFRELGAREMAPMHYGSFPLSGEPMHEPLERLVYYAGGLGLSHRVRLMREGISHPITLGREQAGEI